jgi:hypothetical protein
MWAGFSRPEIHSGLESEARSPKAELTTGA